MLDHARRPAAMPGAAQRRPATAPARPAPAPLPRFSIGALPRSAGGLPDRLRTGIEALSGVSMEGVRVRYNSPHPARLGALAYARGREIHLARGEERHLPHEAWHLVQQAQGRVRANLRSPDGTPVNDNAGLEREADRMGARALSGPAPAASAPTAALASTSAAPAQRVPWWLKAGLIGAGGAALVGGLVAAAPAVAIGGAVAAGAGLAAHYLDGRDRAGDWFDKRHRTSYGYTNVGGKTTDQGPHVIPHIGKTMMAERSVARKPGFDPGAIRARSGLLPSPGQARRLLRIHEAKTGLAIPLGQKKALDKAYKTALAERQHAKTKAARGVATAKAIELSPLSTYAHGRTATHAEISGKGESRKTVGPDLDLMEKMTKHGPMPAFAKVDFPPGGYEPKHLHKFLRDTGKVSRGEEDLSDLELDSDDEYA